MPQPFASGRCWACHDPHGAPREHLLARDGNALCLTCHERVRDRLADPKLQKATKLIRSLLDDGFNPIVFCAYIPTAEYVAEHLRSKLPKDVAVSGVTGRIPAAEREERVLELGEAKRRVLVATDCLSEGVNLQGLFDAVVHYDLAWNPTRHEQR